MVAEDESKGGGETVPGRLAAGREDSARMGMNGDEERRC